MRCIIPTREWVRVCVKHSNTRQKLWLKPKEQQLGACGGMAFAENLFNIKCMAIKRSSNAFVSSPLFFGYCCSHFFVNWPNRLWAIYFIISVNNIIFFPGAYERRAKNYRTFVFQLTVTFINCSLCSKAFEWVHILFGERCRSINELN